MLITGGHIKDNQHMAFSCQGDVVFSIDPDFDFGEWYVHEPRVLAPDLKASRVELRNLEADGKKPSLIVPLVERDGGSSRQMRRCRRTSSVTHESASTRA